MAALASRQQLRDAICEKECAADGQGAAAEMAAEALRQQLQNALHKKLHTDQQWAGWKSKADAEMQYWRKQRETFRQKASNAKDNMFVYVFVSVILYITCCLVSFWAGGSS